MSTSEKCEYVTSGKCPTIMVMKQADTSKPDVGLHQLLMENYCMTPEHTRCIERGLNRITDIEQRARPSDSIIDARDEEKRENRNLDFTNKKR